MKKGDKVICVDDKGCSGLKAGYEYTVKSFYNDGKGVHLEELAKGVFADRFRVVTTDDVVDVPNDVFVAEMPKESKFFAAVKYDFINPNHYKTFSVETIDMMVAIYGKQAVAMHCEMCAFKYKMRVGDKPDQPVQRDLDKVKWYLDKAKELRI